MITSAVPGACQTRGHIQVPWVARRPRPDVDLHRGAPRARRSGAGRLARPQSWGVGVEPQRLHGTGAGKGASGRATDSLKRQILCRAKPKRGFRPCDPRGRRCQRRWHAEGSPQVGASFSSENGPGTRGVRDTAPRRRRPGVRRAVQVNRSGPRTRGAGALSCARGPLSAASRRPCPDGASPLPGAPGVPPAFAPHASSAGLLPGETGTKGTLAQSGESDGQDGNSGQEAFVAGGCRGECGRWGWAGGRACLVGLGESLSAFRGA